MVKNPEFAIIIPSEMSPIVPLVIPNPAVKKRLRRVPRPAPEKFDFDRQRFEWFREIKMPKVVPYKPGKMGRIVMVEAA